MTKREACVYSLRSGLSPEARRTRPATMRRNMGVVIGVGDTAPRANRAVDTHVTVLKNMAESGIDHLYVHNNTNMY